MTNRLVKILESSAVRNGIIGVILFNALLLGLETSQVAMAQFGTLIKMLDVLCLAIFVVELVAKLVAYRTSFFKMAGICLILSL